MKRLEQEYENIRVALQWLHERQERDAALRLPIALLQFWVRRGRMSGGRSLLEQALKALREDDTEHINQVRVLRATKMAENIHAEQNHSRVGRRTQTMGSVAEGDNRIEVYVWLPTRGAVGGFSGRINDALDDALGGVRPRPTSATRVCQLDQ